MSDNRVAMDGDVERADETMEDLEKTILSMCSGVGQRSPHAVEASGAVRTSKDSAGSQERSLLNNLSPIKRAEQEVAVVTPLTHTWMGTAQSTPITDTTHCPVYNSRRRGLLYPSGPDLEMQAEDGDSFTSYENIYDDGKTYEDLLLEVSRICGGSMAEENNETLTNISRINVGDIVSTTEKPATSILPGPSRAADIGDERYFAQTLTSSAMSGRFTGVHKSRHVFDESTVEIDPEPSADILGLDKFICSDLDDDEEEADSDDDNATAISRLIVLDTYDATMTDSIVHTDPVSQSVLQINSNKCLKETREDGFGCALSKVVSSLSHSRSSLTSKESGELSDTLLESDDCTTSQATPVKAVPVNMRKRKRKLLRSDSEREEGELTSTATEASASEVEELDATLVKTTLEQDILKEVTDDISLTAKSEPHGVAAEPAERPCEGGGDAVPASEAPGAATEVPETSTTVSEASLAVPQESAVAPAPSTEVPEATTEVPEATTEVPEASTEVPKASTEVPEASTEEPEASTEVPEASTEALQTFKEQPEVKVEAGHDVKPEPKDKAVLPSPNVLCDDFVLSLTEDEDDVRRVIGESKKNVVKTQVSTSVVEDSLLISGKHAHSQRGKTVASESFQESMISEICEKLMKEKDVTNYGSFTIIDSPGKCIDESFVVISESAVSASSDLVDKDVKKNIVMIKTEDCSSSVADAEGTKKISNTNIVKAMPQNRPVSDVKQGIILSPITAPETKKTSIKSEARISPTEKNILEYETGLMRSVRLKWGSQGIHRPDKNLTYSSWVRKTRTDRKVEPTYILEGNSKVPPLFRKKSVPISECSETISRSGSPKPKKPRIHGTPGKASGDGTKSIKSELQKQLTEIQTEEKRLSSVMTMQQEAFLHRLRAKHGKMFQALRTQQNLERRQLFATCGGYISPALTEYQMMQLKQEHMFQLNQLEAVNGMEMQRGFNIINQERQAQANRFQSLKLPAWESIKKFEENTASGAQMDDAHITVGLSKGAPCGPGVGERDIVKVCLPVDVAAFMIREDEVYDAHYVT
ncbi:uncharacterized protein [Haliotis cracherodii]|uniref:uncharacterized protein n=1 Tax=Haliotis cracherodii TaxID=6455 RepID=UPI0039E739FF